MTSSTKISEVPFSRATGRILKSINFELFELEDGMTMRTAEIASAGAC